MKRSALLEIGLVFLLLNVLKPFAFLLNWLGFFSWEMKHLGWSYIGGILLFLIPIMIIKLKKHTFQNYRILPENPAFDLDLGLKGYLASLVPWILGFGLIAILGSNYDQVAGSLILSGSYLVTIGLFTFFTRDLTPDKHYQAGFIRKQLLTYGIILAFPMVLSILLRRFSGLLLSTLIWQFAFSGFGEEFYWRGYFQGRLNQAFDKPFSIFGVRFGIGLIITSLLFGISHGLNTTNLLAGKFSFGWWWALWTCFSGFFFGLIREKSGSILAPGLVHGTVDAVGESIAKIFQFMG